MDRQTAKKEMEQFINELASKFDSGVVTFAVLNVRMVRFLEATRTILPKELVSEYEAMLNDVLNFAGGVARLDSPKRISEFESCRKAIIQKSDELTRKVEGL